MGAIFFLVTILPWSAYSISFASDDDNDDDSNNIYLIYTLSKI